MPSDLNKLTKYAVLALMLLVGGVSPVLQTLDSDENLGVTFPEPRFAAHTDAVKASQSGNPPTPVIFASLASPFAHPHFGSGPALTASAVDSRHMECIALAVLAIPLRP